jgi:endogenous inhibitor of DNA gyrase (YacG/DUF329 family)
MASKCPNCGEKPSEYIFLEDQPESMCPECGAEVEL